MWGFSGEFDGGDWGAGTLADALYTFSNDVTRVHSLLPELALADRCAFSHSVTPILDLDDRRTSCNYVACLHSMLPVFGSGRQVRL